MTSAEIIGTVEMIIKTDKIERNLYMLYSLNIEHLIYLSSVQPSHILIS